MEPDIPICSLQPTETFPLQTTDVQSGNEGVKALVNEAKSIQALLRSYQERSDTLKQDLSEFVHREIDEHNKLLHLRAVVNQAELAGLKNSKYVEYATRRSKGQQRRRGLVKILETDTLENVAANADESSPTFVADKLLSDGKVWWEKKLERGSSPLLRKWLPDVVLPLQDEDDVTHVWLGWKSVSKASTDAFARVVNRVYPISEAKGELVEQVFACFGNGVLYTTVAETDASGLANLKKETDALVATADRLSRSGGQNGVSDSLARKVALIATLYSAKVCGAVAMTRTRFIDCMWPKSGESASGSHCIPAVADGLRLCGDGKDVLTFVKPDRLQGTVTVRAFFFHGVVSLVEQVGAEVDMTTFLMPPGHNLTTVEDCRFCVRSSILRTLRTLYAGLTNPMSEGSSTGAATMSTNLVLTVALKQLTSKDGLFDGVLLDARPISPQLPFEGRTTWIEVCAVGRRQGAAHRCGGVGNEKTDGAADVVENSVEDVVFRLAYLTVAFLQPYDALSRQVFPLLNEAIKLQMAGPNSAEVAARKSSNEKPTLLALPAPYVTTATLCLGVASCVALAVGVARWLRC